MKKLKDMPISKIERFYFNKINNLFNKIETSGSLLITFSPPSIALEPILENKQYLLEL